MLPSEHVAVSLLSIGSRRNPLERYTGVAVQPVQEQPATVMHLDAHCQDSFVDIELVRQLFWSKYGGETPMPQMDGDTRVQLQWHYLPLHETEVTKHRVVHNVQYQIILRKQDWERPVRLWLQRECQQQRRHCPDEPREPQQGIHRRGTITGSESDAEHCDTWSIDEAPIGSSDLDCSDEELVIVDQADAMSEDDGEWLEADDASDVEFATTAAYWDWSQTEQQWYHTNDEGSTRWFPPLD